MLLGTLGGLWDTVGVPLTGWGLLPLFFPFLGGRKAGLMALADLKLTM